MLDNTEMVLSSATDLACYFVLTMVKNALVHYSKSLRARVSCKIESPQSLDLNRSTNSVHAFRVPVVTRVEHNYTSCWDKDRELWLPQRHSMRPASVAHVESSRACYGLDAFENRHHSASIVTALVSSMHASACAWPKCLPFL